MLSRAHAIRFAVFTALGALAALAGCRDATGKESAPGLAPAAQPAAQPAAGSAGELASTAPKAPKGENAEDYVPAEFKAGMSRWKDTGVYVDGKPIAFLQFGE